MHTRILYLKIFDLSAKEMPSCPYLTVSTHMLSHTHIHTHTHTHTHRLNEIPIYTMDKRKKSLRSLLILIDCLALLWICMTKVTGFRKEQTAFLPFYFTLD